LSLVEGGNVELVVPLHFDLETMGFLVKCHRSKNLEFNATWLKSAARMLDILPIQVTAIGINHALLCDLALAFNVSVYDTPYLQLARMLDIPLATRDKGLISACKQWNVQHWQP
jgi:predicted nucleic acid-binding protein